MKKRPVFPQEFKSNKKNKKKTNRKRSERPSDPQNHGRLEESLSQR